MRSIPPSSRVLIAGKDDFHIVPPAYSFSKAIRGMRSGLGADGISVSEEESYLVSGAGLAKAVTAEVSSSSRDVFQEHAIKGGAAPQKIAAQKQQQRSIPSSFLSSSGTN